MHLDRSKIGLRFEGERCTTARVAGNFFCHKKVHWQSVRLVRWHMISVDCIGTRLRCVLQSSENLLSSDINMLGLLAVLLGMCLLEGVPAVKKGSSDTNFCVQSSNALSQIQSSMNYGINCHIFQI
jgi:hypothetical protein